MTHEEFIRLKPEDGITLTDEDRKAIENTIGWQGMKLVSAMRTMMNELDKSWRKTFGLKEKTK